MKRATILSAVIACLGLGLSSSPASADAAPQVASAAHQAPQKVWIAGHWGHAAGQAGLVWIPGHWALAPRAGLAWTAGHWRGYGKQRHWVPGHWR